MKKYLNLCIYAVLGYPQYRQARKQGYTRAAAWKYALNRVQASTVGAKR